ncbi:MAG: AbrB/MazE/SpoVT family DNA-binding domain-containing protein [Deinococcota bacterium]|nr:AbrB/MazE/SpoVT family DNA-binding domain-containing protein [Deinococcota bacterium]
MIADVRFGYGMLAPVLKTRRRLGYFTRWRSSGEQPPWLRRWQVYAKVALMKTVLMDRFGRVLIPKEVRDALKLAPGQALRLEVENGKVVLEPRSKEVGLVRKGRALVFCGGSLTEDPSDWVSRMREERAQELIRRSNEITS